MSDSEGIVNHREGGSLGGSIDRRRMLKRVGAAGAIAWSAPLLSQVQAFADGSQCATTRVLDWGAFNQDPIVFPKTLTFSTDVTLTITESFHGTTTSYGVSGDPDRGIYDNTPPLAVHGGLPAAAPNDYTGEFILIWQTARTPGGRVLTFNFTKPGTGDPVTVKDLQFWITDIDMADNQYDDRVTIQADGVEPNFQRTNVNNTRILGTGTASDAFRTDTLGNVGDGSSLGTIRVNHPLALSTFTLDFWCGSRETGGQHAIFISNMTFNSCTP